jgi:ribonuclease HII
VRVLFSFIFRGRTMKKTIKEIENMLFNKEEATLEDIKMCEQDDRKGVQQLLKRWRKKADEKQAEHDKFIEMSKYELALRKEGSMIIAGIDEVGRGPLAGPVVAAAVILKEDFYLPGINDSKKLSEAKRKMYFQYISEHALAIGIGIMNPAEIDQLNIYEATKQAMQKAIEACNLQPDHLLIDAMELPVTIPQTSIIKGDANSITIAASSIIAKETRDNMMKELDKQYPQYGFKNHMGYGTKQHIEAIYKHGVTKAHRRTFAPIKEMI